MLPVPVIYCILPMKPVNRRSLRKSSARTRVRSRANATAAPAQSNVAPGTLSTGARLSGNLHQEMGKHFRGSDLKGVNLHYDHHAAQMAHQLGASAFTVNKDIYFAQGRYQPATRDGKRLLAHELTHALHHDDGVLRKQDDPSRPLSDEENMDIWRNSDPNAPQGADKDGASRVWPKPRHGLSGQIDFDIMNGDFDWKVGPIINGYDLSGVPDALGGLRSDYPIPVLLPNPTDPADPAPREPDFNEMARQCVEQYKQNPEVPYPHSMCPEMIAMADPGTIPVQEQLDLPFYHPRIASRYASFTIDNFLSNEQGVNPRERETIQQGVENIARMLSLHPAARVALEGHTDEAGGHESNYLLGLGRAMAVEGVLNSLGVPAPFDLSSKGESDPRVSAKEDGRNRRVEVRFQP